MSRHHVLGHQQFAQGIDFQVDSLIEAFYHLDENVKGEFLGMQMNKARTVLLQVCNGT
jgi:hypothetical protein